MGPWEEGREVRRFPSGCVATPHHLASSVGVAVLADGGNALDAAVAANLVLAVVMPDSCGPGGDLFAMVWAGGGAPVCYNGSGRAPAAATVEAVRDAAGPAVAAMPKRGSLSVTVPGAPEAWFALVDRFGTRSFPDLCGPAIRMARDGFPLTAFGADGIASAGREHPAGPPFDEWRTVYGHVVSGARLVQEGAARTLEALAAGGPQAFYTGPVGAAIAGTLARHGGLMSTEDLAAHRGEWTEPLATTYRGVEIFEMPPNTQGVTALEALNVVEAAGPLPPDGPERQHLLIEAVKVALADRDAFVTDPDLMAVAPEEIASKGWAAARLVAINRSRAGTPLRAAMAGGDTVYLCAADRRGMMVSLIQSNFNGFGSGITVPEWGVNLHNRGATFSLDPGHANVVAPGKRTLHTLIPAMAFRDGRPWMAFGSMGGHGQAQIHLQVLARMVDDGQDPQRAIDAPRWIVDPNDWSVEAESRFDPAEIEALRAMGHRVEVAGPFDRRMGWAQAIVREDTGYAAASDPRSEGAASGL